MYVISGAVVIVTGGVVLFRHWADNGGFLYCWDGMDEQLTRLAPAAITSDTRMPLLDGGR